MNLTQSEILTIHNLEEEKHHLEVLEENVTESIHILQSLCDHTYFNDGSIESHYELKCTICGKPYSSTLESHKYRNSLN